MTIQERLIAVVVEKLGKDETEVALDSRFQEDLGADSLDVVELVMELEDEFDIEVPDEAAEHLKTVGDALDYIEKNT